MLALRQAWRDPVVWLATGGGVGLIPWAPGTFGTLPGLLLAWLCARYAPGWPTLLVILPLVLLGVPLCQSAVERLNRGKDPGCIVWDELVALPLVFCGLPFESPGVIVAGFLLFRLFDISKLPPGRQLEHLPGGWGIMADDLAAAAFAHVVLRGLIAWNPGGVLLGG